MQAVLLTAGKSSRFHPFTNFPHKSLIPLMGKTIFEHTLGSIKKSGINEVVAVVNKKDPFTALFGDGSKLGMNIKYIVFPKALGMGEALLAAKNEAKDQFFLTNGYHMEFDEIASEMIASSKNHNVILLGKKDKNSSSYGYIKSDKGMVEEIVEKPSRVTSEMLRIVGIYLLNIDFLRVLLKVPSEHYSFEKALDEYNKKHSISFVETKKETITLKYPWDLFEIKDYLLDRVENHISYSADISDSAKLSGNILVEDGAKIMEGAVIKGPAYIGKNSVVGNNSLLRGGVTLEEGSVIGAYMEVKNSIIMKGSKTHSGFLGDSIIGENCRLGDKFSSANVRIDRKNIQVLVKSEKVDTGRRDLGVICGNNVKIGARVSTMPGVIIGENSVIGPSTTVLQNVASNIKFYTKFESVVEKNN